MIRMGLVRNIIKTTSIFLFSFLLSLSILTFLLYDLTKYENAKNIFTTFFKEIVVREEKWKIEEIFNRSVNYCKSYPNYTIELSTDVSIHCSEILNTNLESFISLIANKYFDRIYYKTYDCEMPKCVKELKSSEDFAVLMSLKAHEFLKDITKLLLVLTTVSGILLFISLETWLGRIKTFGLEFLSIGIFYFLTPFLKRIFIEKFLSKSLIDLTSLDLIFNKIKFITMIFLVSGLILIFTWILLKIFGKKS